MTGGTLTILAFRGHGFVPVLIRLATWRWWLSQPWGSVPAHVAIWDSQAHTEYEAIVTGIQSSPLDGLDSLVGLCETVPVVVPDIESARDFLRSQVGKRYGFEAVALTGLAILSPGWLDRLWVRCWGYLAGGKSGRTAPLHCSLLAHMALRAGGLELSGTNNGLPVSPNDLLRNLK